MSDALRAIIVREDSDTLIVQASAEQIAAFAAQRQEAIRLERVGVNAQIEDAIAELRHGFLYDRLGRRVAVVESIETSREMLDVTSFGDTRSVWMRGVTRYRITASGPV